jgi:hypothetical protein
MSMKSIVMHQQLCLLLLLTSSALVNVLGCSFPKTVDVAFVSEYCKMFCELHLNEG